MVIVIVRQDQAHKAYDEAQRDAYCAKLDSLGVKYDRVDDVQREDGNHQTEITFHG